MTVEYLDVNCSKFMVMKSRLINEWDVIEFVTLCTYALKEKMNGLIPSPRSRHATFLPIWRWIFFEQAKLKLMVYYSHKPNGLLKRPDVASSSLREVHIWKCQKTQTYWYVCAFRLYRVKNNQLPNRTSNLRFPLARRAWHSHWRVGER